MAKLHVGAGLIRRIIEDAAPEDAAQFARLIWPSLSKAQAELIAKFPDECGASGAYLVIPDSWGRVSGAPSNENDKRGKRTRAEIRARIDGKDE